MFTCPIHWRAPSGPVTNAWVSLLSKWAQERFPYPLIGIDTHSPTLRTKSSDENEGHHLQRGAHWVHNERSCSHLGSCATTGSSWMHPHSTELTAGSLAYLCRWEYTADPPTGFWPLQHSVHSRISECTLASSPGKWGQDRHNYLPEQPWKTAVPHWRAHTCAQPEPSL